MRRKNRCAGKSIIVKEIFVFDAGEEMMHLHQSQPWPIIPQRSVFSREFGCTIRMRPEVFLVKQKFSLTLRDVKESEVASPRTQCAVLFVECSDANSHNLLHTTLTMMI